MTGASATPDRTRVQNRQISRTTVHGWPAVLFSLPFTGTGVGVVLASAGVIPVSASSFNAPRWVVGIVGLCFALAGGWLMIHGVLGLVAAQRRRRMELTRPNEPWLADYAWDPSGTPSRDTRSLLGQLVGVAFIGLFLSPFHWWAFGPAGNWFVLGIVTFFDLIMLLVLGTIVRKAIARARYGRPWLRFVAFPFHPGDLIDVELVPPRGIGRFEGMTITLRYFEERYQKTSSGDGERTVINCCELYIDTIEVGGPGRHLAGDSALPITFALPDDALPCGLGERPARFWELQVHAGTGGVDFDHRFLIPIYGRAVDTRTRHAA